MQVFSILCMQFSMPAIQRKQKGESKSPPSNCQICSWKSQDRNVAGKIQRSANCEGLDSPFPRIVLGQRRVLEWAFANPWPTWIQGTREETSVELCWLAVAKGAGLPAHMSPLALTAGHTPCRGGRDVVDVIALTGGTPAEIFQRNNREAEFCKKRSSKYLW